MRIGVFSDVHDNVDKLRQTLKAYESQTIDTAIFCGDFCSPIPAKIMGEAKDTLRQIHCVFGNGDGDRLAIERLSKGPSSNLILHGEHAEIELGEKKLAVTHYPLYGKALARTGDYQAVFSGHTHELHEERFGDALWLNPGDVMGFKGKATCAIYDLLTNTAEIIEL